MQTVYIRDLVKIHKEFLQINNKKITQSKNGYRIWTFLKDKQMANKHTRRYSTYNNQRNISQNHNDITNKTAISKSRIANVGKDVEY